MKIANLQTINNIGKVDTITYQIKSHKVLTN